MLSNKVVCTENGRDGSWPVGTVYSSISCPQVALEMQQNQQVSSVAAVQDCRAASRGDAVLCWLVACCVVVLGGSAAERSK